MTRRRGLPPAALLGAVAVVGLAAAAACAPEPPGAARAFAAPPPSRTGAAAASTAGPTAALPAPIAPGSGRGGPPTTYVSPPLTPAQRDQAEIVATCRNQAEQIILQRDRGQLLREDERDARIGASASIYDLRAPIDRLGRGFARDRLAEDCVDANRPRPPAPITVPAAAEPATPPPPPTPAAAATRSGTRARR